MICRLEDFFTDPIPKHIKSVIKGVLGKEFDEGQFYSSFELDAENDLFKQGSDIKSGICIGQDGGGEYLFIDNVKDTYILYSLINGYQGHRKDYTLIFEINEQDTPATFIERINQYYNILYS